MPGAARGACRWPASAALPRTGGTREARLGGAAEAQEVDGEDPACGAQGRVRVYEDAEAGSESWGVEFFEAVTS